MSLDTVRPRGKAAVGAEFAALASVAARLPELTDREREQARQRVLRALHHRIRGRDRGDQPPLFPAVADRLNDSLIGVPMNYDRLAIEYWGAKIAAADVADTARLQGLLWGLDALVRVYVWKQNELDLALVGRSTPS